MKRKIFLAAACMIANWSEAATRTQQDFYSSLGEHAQYVGGMYELFLHDPSTADTAKIAVQLRLEELLRNTSATAAYESLVIGSNGAVCGSPVADRMPKELAFEEDGRAMVMFSGGTVKYVNTAYFRDLCVLYKQDPKRVSDIYTQQMIQIKEKTGGRTYDQLKRGGTR